MAGKKSASNGIVWVGLGSLFGVIVDFLYQSNAVPGSNTPLQGCNALTVGDAMQIGALSGANVLSAFTNNFTFSALTSGMILGNIAPKIMAMMGKPRYFIYDLSSTGSINPILRQQPKAPAVVKK
jgi:hypothetical protein